MLRRVRALVLLALCGCDCGRAPSEEDAPAAVAWAELSRCLAGDEGPTPDRIRRIAMAAQLEVVDDLPDPGPATGEMGGQNAPPRVRRSWPWRCRPYARDLEDVLGEAPEARLARRVAEALGDGEVDPALYELAEATGDWPTPEVRGVTPPPTPASPLPGEDARPLVSGAGCVSTVVLGDATTAPMRQVAHVVCEGDRHHRCTFSGEDLQTVACEAVEELPSVWSLHEARVGDWTAGLRRDAAGCHDVVDGTPRGDFDCPDEDLFWARPCRAGDFEAVALIAPRHAGLAIRDGEDAQLVEPPVTPDGGVVLSCTPEGLFIHHTSSTSELLHDEMRPGMIRPPTRSLLDVAVHRCTSAGCDSAESRMIAHGAYAKAAPLGSRVITSELFETDEGDGVLVRVAPLEELPDSPARWVLHPSGGVDLDAHHSEWIVGAQTAVLLVTDLRHGLLALRFGPNGEPTFLAPP